MKAPFILLLTAALGLVAIPKAPAQHATATTTAAVTTATPLDKALDSIQVDKLRSDLYFIASDDMQGRDTVSVGQRIAARFIQARVQRLGFQPGNGDKFLYEYPLDQAKLERDSLAAEWVQGEAKMPLAYGTDYMLAGTSAFQADTTAEVVYVGTGELKGDHLKDRWALVESSDGRTWNLRRDARRAGVAGLLVAPGEGVDLLEKLAGGDSGLFEGNLSYPGSSNRWGTPTSTVVLSADTAKALIGDAAMGDVLSAQFHQAQELAEGSQIMAENVTAFWPGSDPVLKNEVIIVSAHYDHVGVNGDDIFNGADDNGSGTVGLLALAEALSNYGPLRRSVMIIWVSGEEKGLWGSKAWASNPSLPEGAHAVLNINTDMIGRKAPSELYVTPSSKHPGYNGLTRLAEQFAKLEGFGDFPEGREQGFEGLGSADVYYSRSDHAEFAKLEIPVCFLFAGEHEDYHRPSDTPDKIDYDKIRRVVRLVTRMLDQLQGDTLNL